MNEETAKELIAAIDRLAVALQGLQSPGYFGGGIHVHHHAIPPQHLQPGHYWYPYQTMSQTGGFSG